MKLSFLVFLTGVFLFAGIASGNTVQKRLCVIGFERRDFPVSLGLKKIFKDNPNSRLVIEGGPKDLEACLREDFDEIILVTHAFFVDGDNQRVTLGYFQELKEDERDDLIEANEKLIRHRLSELQLSLEKKNTVKKRIERRRLRKLLTKIQQTSSDRPLYTSPQILFSRFFDRLKSILDSKQESGDLRLKKFRLMTCASDLILEKYPFFTQLTDFGIELDVAPSSRIASFFKGHQVTNLNGPWLKKSLK